MGEHFFFNLFHFKKKTTTMSSNKKTSNLFVQESSGLKLKKVIVLQLKR